MGMIFILRQLNIDNTNGGIYFFLTLPAPLYPILPQVIFPTLVLNISRLCLVDKYHNPLETGEIDKIGFTLKQ